MRLCIVHSFNMSYSVEHPIERLSGVGSISIKLQFTTFFCISKSACESLKNKLLFFKITKSFNKVKSSTWSQVQCVPDVRAEFSQNYKLIWGGPSVHTNYLKVTNLLWFIVTTCKFICTIEGTEDTGSIIQVLGTRVTLKIAGLKGKGLLKLRPLLFLKSPFVCIVVNSLSSNFFQSICLI